MNNRCINKIDYWIIIWLKKKLECMPVTYRHSFQTSRSFCSLVANTRPNSFALLGFTLRFFFISSSISSMTWVVDLLALWQNLLTIKPSKAKQLFAQKGYSTLWIPLFPRFLSFFLAFWWQTFSECVSSEDIIQFSPPIVWMWHCRSGAAVL